ncbi:hypothetical protein [Sphingobium nicotianae]|uniref:Uncharacterized protein n=1 Tax=Sphingobium nicotianae TaxID=2782607 RepID=A0A9X1D9E9_9SPHN|nr:hypothetical protein [Sphingobium nicotianae]MBT2185556.1 hypothetical protein [Sphingobium nicotianae]
MARYDEQGNNEDLSDAGWLKGLPAGWIDGFICARHLFRRLKAEYGDGDPAPWHDVINADYWGPHFGDPPEDYASKQKLSVRIVATIQRALLSGQLAASWFDGSDFRSIPMPAAQNTSALHNALLHGTFEIDPLWSDEWQHWNGQGWAIEKEQFEVWLASPDAVDPAGLPPQIPTQLEPDEFAISSRKPSVSEHVPLSEAVSWIAFGVALNADRLDQALRWRRLCGGDLDTAQHRLQDAAATLLEAGSSGRVSFFGRHIDAYEDKGKRTEKIDVLALVDYRQVLITGHDHLRYGEGLCRWYKSPNDSHLRGSDRRDLFSNVTVARSELMTQFPGGESPGDTENASAASVPLAIGVGELQLPDEHFDPLAAADIAPWWTVLQSLAWVATRSAAFVERVGELEAHNDQEIAQFICSSMVLLYVSRNACTCAAAATDPVNRWEWCTCFRDAGRQLLDQIRLNYVHPVQLINGVSRPMAFHEFAGVGQRPTGADWHDLKPAPIFSSAEVIAAIPHLPSEIDRSVGYGRAPAVKTGRPPSDGEILSKADEMKARGLDGRTIAKCMRLEPGFENVATTTVRDLIKGRWKPAGRPKKAA